MTAAKASCGKCCCCGCIAFQKHTSVCSTTLLPQSTRTSQPHTFQRTMQPHNDEDDTLAFPARVPSSLKTMDLATPEGKQRLLLALRCYQEFSISTNSTPLLPSLHHAMENFGMGLGGCSSDCVRLQCRGPGTPCLQRRHFQGELVPMPDWRHWLRATGIRPADVPRIDPLSFAANDLSSKSAGHLSTVISSNNSTLQLVIYYLPEQLEQSS